MEPAIGLSATKGWTQIGRAGAIADVVMRIDPGAAGTETAATVAVAAGAMVRTLRLVGIATVTEAAAGTTATIERNHAAAAAARPRDPVADLAPVLSIVLWSPVRRNLSPIIR